MGCLDCTSCLVYARALFASAKLDLSVKTGRKRKFSPNCGMSFTIFEGKSGDETYKL